MVSVLISIYLSLPCAWAQQQPSAPPISASAPSPATTTSPAKAKAGAKDSKASAPAAGSAATPTTGKTWQPVVEQAHRENRLIVSVVGSKTLSESVDGGGWTFDSPSVAIEIQASEYVAAQVSLTVLQQQYLLDKEGASVLFERRRLLLPVMVSYRAFTWFYISAGPYIGFALNEAKTFRRGLNPAFSPPKSSMDDFVEFGFTSALQFFVPISKQIEGSFGLHYYIPYDEAQLKKSNSIFFTAGIKFGLGK